MGLKRWQVEEKDKQIEKLKTLLRQSIELLFEYVEHFERQPKHALKAKQMITKIKLLLECK